MVHKPGMQSWPYTDKNTINMDNQQSEKMFRKLHIKQNKIHIEKEW